MIEETIKIQNAKKLIQDLESNFQRFQPHHNSVCEVKKYLELVFFRGRRGSRCFTVFATHTDDRVFYLFDTIKEGFVYRGITNEFIKYSV